MVTLVLKPLGFPPYGTPHSTGIVKEAEPVKARSCDDGEAAKGVAGFATIISIAVAGM
jgi:hypothetical protein